MTERRVIRHHMEVVAACGAKLGRVDEVEGRVIRLHDGPDGRHHFLPLAWVAGVDERVRLNRTAEQTAKAWASAGD